jgi:hypothetical protein
MQNVSIAVVTKARVTATYYLTTLSGITANFPDRDTGEGREERFAPFLVQPSHGHLAAITFD